MHRLVHVFLPAEIDGIEIGEKNLYPQVEELLDPWYVESLSPDQHIVTYDWFRSGVDVLPTTSGERSACRIGDLTARQNAAATLAFFETCWRDMERYTAHTAPFTPFSYCYRQNPDPTAFQAFINQPFLTEARRAIPLEEWLNRPEQFFRLETGGYDDYLAYHTLGDVPAAWVAPGEGWRNCDDDLHKPKERLRLAEEYRTYRDNADANSWIVALDCHY